MRKHAHASIHPAVTAFQSLQKKRANSCIHREEEEDDEEVKEEKEEDDAL